MNEFSQKIIVGRFQPLHIISYLYLASMMPYFSIPVNSAQMLFSIPVIFVLACANFAYLVIVELLGTQQSKFKGMLIIFPIFLGGFGIMVVGWSTDTLDIISDTFVDDENTKFEFWHQVAIVYTLLGGFVFELYQVYIHKIANKISICFLSKAFYTT